MIAAGAIPAADIRVGSQQALAVYAGEELVWESVPLGPPYLTFSSPSAFTLAVSNASKNWDGTLEWSVNGETWSVWDGTSTISAMAGDDAYCLYLRGYGNTYISERGHSFVLTGTSIACDGDIRNLLNHASPRRATMAAGCFDMLFAYNVSLVRGPSLPSVALSDSCYSRMYFQCTALAEAPELPATTLARQCYRRMFFHCDSLSVPPRLPAKTLALGCYDGMFEYCSALTSIPELPANVLADYCYKAMFFNAASIKVSETQTGEYVTPYRIPLQGIGIDTATDALLQMFSGTGGTLTGTPSINTTYYTSNTVI